MPNRTQPIARTQLSSNAAFSAARGCFRVMIAGVPHLGASWESGAVAFCASQSGEKWHAFSKLARTAALTPDALTHVSRDLPLSEDVMCNLIHRAVNLQRTETQVNSSSSQSRAHRVEELQQLLVVLVASRLLRNGNRFVVRHERARELRRRARPTL